MASERMSKKVLLEMVPLVSCIWDKKKPNPRKNPKQPANNQLLFLWYVLCCGLLAQEKKKETSKPPPQMLQLHSYSVDLGCRAVSEDSLLKY